MASDQSVRNEETSVQLSVEEKASVDEIVKQAELSLESQELLDRCIGVVAENESLENESLDKAATSIKIQILVGVLKNQTKGPLTVMAKHKYAGHVVKNFPDPLTSTGGFCMSALSDKGIMAAVVYSGKNIAGVECAWLLAFAATNPGGRRIYAECGRKDKYSNINWAKVEDKLDSDCVIVKAYDEETGTSLYGTIVGKNGKSAVGAAFFG